MNLDKFIASDVGDPEMKVFLEAAISNFFTELDKYITQNCDDDILKYGTERTMTSLFVCGNARKDEDFTAVQEYGTICTKNGKEVHGRPDIFIKKANKAIWVECKYDRSVYPLGEDHWDIPGWLKWDLENAYSQVETYYISETEKLNMSYDQRYLVTLCFKLVNEIPKEHFSKVKSNLREKMNLGERPWYYQVGFLENSSEKSSGIEVYGTCSEDLKNIIYS